MAIQRLEPHELTLRFVPAKDVALHEETDSARVNRIRAALDNDGVLRNPPIVGKGLTDTPHVVLDGATRTTALKLMGARDILIQGCRMEEKMACRCMHGITFCQN